MEKIFLFIPFALLFVWGVFKYVAFRRSRARPKTIQSLKKIIATGKPEVVPADRVPISELNRRTRRRLMKIKEPKKSAVLKNQRNEILDAKEFAKRHNIQNKFFDGTKNA